MIVGVSIGIAIAPADGIEPDVLMKNADLALYRAKADGGATYRYFEAEMDARMQERRVLELDLRKAIVNGEFELYYQPIIDIRSRQIISCEALVRWHHPQRGLVPPLDFISIAEETGLIVPLGRMGIARSRQASRAMADARDHRGQRFARPVQDGRTSCKPWSASSRNPAWKQAGWNWKSPSWYC